MNKIVNPNLLLDQNWAQTFFIQNSQKIFGNHLSIKVLNINRSYTFNTESYNILYSLDVAGKKIAVRASFSTQANKQITYDVLRYLRTHCFDKDNILVPKPYAFFQDYNILLYEDIPGETFMYELKVDLEILKKKIILAAQALKKFHALEPPSSKLWQQDWNLNKPAIGKHYSVLAAKVDEIQKYIFQELKKTKSEDFCHGDYQPNNLIFNQNKLYVIDFGSVCVLDKEIDIASFILQLKIMLQYFGDPANFNNLKEKFISGYGNFDLKKCNFYSILLSLRILDFFIVFPDTENNRERIPFGYELVKENLDKIGISLKNAQT